MVNRMKKIMIVVIVIGLIAFGSAFLYQKANTTEAAKFQFAELTRGDLENIVSSTGTLSAIGTVNVGSQISGTLEKVLVDYNDKVTKGQILAVVDTTLLNASIRDAEANIMQRRAQLNQAKTTHQRKQTLFKQGYLSEMELLSVKTDVETSNAALKSAEISLERAKTNLQYAEIRSPIDGTVIERTVDAGQTIATSLSAPTLFTIAEDLSQMQIEASVDESDIGQIKVKQPVRFTVQAYPDEAFTGIVRQIRLKPKTVQDVVNYTVVVDASNERSLLLPGMTATVDFVIEQKKDILLVPNLAMHFKPSEEMLAQLQTNAPKNPAQRQPRNTANAQPLDAQQSNRKPPDKQQSGAKRPENMATVYYLDENGAFAMARFTSGTTDGKMTELLESQRLKEGMRVITGIENQQTTAKSSGFRLPFGGGGPPH